MWLSLLGVYEVCPEYNENKIPTLEKGSVKGEAGQGHLEWDARYTLEHWLVAFQPCQSRDSFLWYPVQVPCIKKNASEFGTVVRDKILCEIG